MHLVVPVELPLWMMFLLHFIRYDAMQDFFSFRKLHRATHLCRLLAKGVYQDENVL